MRIENWELDGAEENFVNCSKPRLYWDTLTTVHAHSSTLTYCIAQTHIQKILSTYAWHQIRILGARTHTIGDADTTSPGVLDLHNTDNTIRIRHTAQSREDVTEKILNRHRFFFTLKIYAMVTRMSFTHTHTHTHATQVYTHRGTLFSIFFLFFLLSSFFLFPSSKNRE